MMYVFNIFDGCVKSSASIIISLLINDKGSIYLVQLHLTTFYSSQNHVRGIESYRLSAPCCLPGSVDLLVGRQASWCGIVTSCYPTSASEGCPAPFTWCILVQLSSAPLVLHAKGAPSLLVR